MHREDFIDASAETVDAGTADGAPSGGGRPERVRRPLNGGWVLMVAAGLIAAVANYAVLTADDGGAEVLVVSEAAPAGTPVDDLRLDRTVLGLDDPGSHLLATDAQLATASGMVTTVRLEAGALLRSSDLRLPVGQGQGAMSLPVDPARAVGGAISPGDVVDVIAETDGAVDYVVSHVEVLDVPETAGGVGQISGGHALTVSVDSDQALALAAALRAGDIDVVRTPGSGG